MRVWKAEIPISEEWYDKYTSIALKNKELQVWEEFVEDIWSGNKQYGKYDMVLCQDLVQNKMRGSAS